MKVMTKLLPFNFLASQRRQLICLSLLGFMMVIIIGACQQIPTCLSPTTSGLAQQQTPSTNPSPIPTDNGIRYGYIDKTGKFVIQLKYLGADSFSNGYASVTTKEGETYIDKAGKMLIPPGLYKTGGCSKDGLCIVEKYEVEPKGDAFFIKTGTYQAGYVDTTGKLVVPLKQYEPSVGVFHNGLALVSQKVKSSEHQEESTPKYGYINPKGEYAIPLQFDAATDFKDGIARVGIKKVEPDRLSWIYGVECITKHRARQISNGFRIR
jgi:hypothetical protein